ncbi:DNA-binding response regulator [Paenimyroides tangerinum]|uniref:DNA-binding response regulator n=1 Tax=Paenimyroides tangerinum TaxID=2488728 RepID=A0A3P3W7P9_9FLAO|nr:response regulator transcription factor [Paenimyroides tangerinum]RRJ90367.1 DNA-binding response regulator [Paenimyroides tangerinum]
MINKFNKFKFITADDHEIIAKSLIFIIKDLYKDAEIYQIDKLSEIVEALKKEKIDLLILDISFPEGDTLTIIPKIKAIQPDIKILVFSGHDENMYAIRYFHANVNGYLSKSSGVNEIKNAITDVMNNGKYFSRNIQNQIMDSLIFKKPSNALQQLSNREFEIAKLLVKGFGNTEISAELDLQKSTVSTYKNRIFEKLEINNVPDLIQIFKLYNEENAG